MGNHVGQIIRQRRQNHLKVELYRFPENPDDRTRWIESLPNQLLNISKDIHICYKHFPPDCPKNIAPGSALVPTVLHRYLVIQTATF